MPLEKRTFTRVRCPEPLGEDDQSKGHNLGLVEIDTFRVRVSTLDTHEGTRDLRHIDLLRSMFRVQKGLSCVEAAC